MLVDVFDYKKISKKFNLRLFYVKKKLIKTFGFGINWTYNENNNKHN